VQEIEEFASGVRETSKLGGIEFIFFVPNWGVYLIQLWTCRNSRHFNCGSVRNWRICQWSSGNFKAWWNWTYLVVSNWGVYPIQLWTCYIIGVQESGEFAIGISKNLVNWSHLIFPIKVFNLIQLWTPNSTLLTSFMTEDRTSLMIFC
jgi:hypothetical protein